MNVVTEILNNRTDYVALMMYLLILFGMGYFCGWFFRGGVLRIMCGLVVAGFPIAHIYSDGTLTIQIAFFGGFLANWFSVFKRMREWLADFTRDIGYQFRQLFTMPKRKQQREPKQSRQQNQFDRESYEAEQARRQAEMEQKRGKQQQQQDNKNNKQRSKKKQQSRKENNQHHNHANQEL